MNEPHNLRPLEQGIELDLRDRTTAVRAFAGCLVVNRLRQAGERPLAIAGVGLQDEACRRRVCPVYKGTLSILLPCFVRR